MPPSPSYRDQELKLASEAIRKGHRDAENLRALLVCTTSETTSQMVEQYFSTQHHNKELLQSLVAIALEGEDSGDAPWAAANVLAEFPAALLSEHKAKLKELSEHPWSYLHVPARQAMAKLAAGDA
jgi:hypothetical protein